MVQDRRREVINICLNHFIEKGLSETSTRSLSSALKLQNAGLYYYFESKDIAVIQCAEEAAIRLETALIPPVFDEIQDPDLMMNNLQKRADEMAATMRFFVSVCVSERYKDGIKPVLDQLEYRYHQYATKIANVLMCDVEDIEPYVYMAITAVANYMIFREDNLINPQMGLVKQAIKLLQGKKKLAACQSVAG